jgi:hypothetical protein
MTTCWLPIQQMRQRYRLILTPVGPAFLDRHSASICSTVDTKWLPKKRNGILEYEIMYHPGWNCFDTPLARLVTKTATQSNLSASSPAFQRNRQMQYTRIFWKRTGMSCIHGHTYCTDSVICFWTRFDVRDELRYPGQHRPIRSISHDLVA